MNQIEQFTVQDILDRRFNKETNQVEYLVKWNGETDTENTWEPIQRLDKPMMAIAKQIEKVVRHIYKKSMEQILKKEILKFIDIQVISGQDGSQIKMKDKYLKTQKKLIYKQMKVNQAQNRIISNNEEIIISDDEIEEQKNQ